MTYVQNNGRTTTAATENPMTAPDKIFAWAFNGRTSGGGWTTANVSYADAEYTRSALIPALLAEARAEGRREGLREVVEAIGDWTDSQHIAEDMRHGVFPNRTTQAYAIRRMVCALLDADTPASFDAMQMAREIERRAQNYYTSAGEAQSAVRTFGGAVVAWAEDGDFSEQPEQPKLDAVREAANDEIERLRDALSEIAAPPAYAMDSEDRVEALRDHARNALKIGASNDLR